VIFVIFNTAAAAILDFQKFEILTVDPLQGASLRHRTVAELMRFNGFQNGGRPPSWIC